MCETHRAWSSPWQRTGSRAAAGTAHSTTSSILGSKGPLRASLLSLSYRPAPSQATKGSSTHQQQASPESSSVRFMAWDLASPGLFQQALAFRRGPEHWTHSKGAQPARWRHQPAANSSGSGWPKLREGARALLLWGVVGVWPEADWGTPLSEGRAAAERWTNGVAVSHSQLVWQQQGETRPPGARGAFSASLIWPWQRVYWATAERSKRTEQSCRRERPEHQRHPAPEWAWRAVPGAHASQQR